MMEIEPEFVMLIKKDFMIKELKINPGFGLVFIVLVADKIYLFIFSVILILNYFEIMNWTLKNYNLKFNKNNLNY